MQVKKENELLVKNNKQNFSDKDDILLIKLYRKIKNLEKNRKKNLYTKYDNIHDTSPWTGMRKKPSERFRLVKAHNKDKVDEYDNNLNQLKNYYENYKSFYTIKQEKQAAKELQKKNKKDEADKIKLLKKQEKLKIKELKKQEADKIKLLKKQDKLKIKELKKQEADKIKLLKKKEAERIKNIKKQEEIKQVKKDVNEAIEEYKNKQNENKPVDINKLRNEGIRRILIKIENLLTNNTEAIFYVNDLSKYNITTKEFLIIVKNNIKSYDKIILEIMEQNFEKLYRVLNDENLNNISTFSNENIKRLSSNLTYSDAQFVEFYYNAIRYKLSKIIPAATYNKFKGKFLYFTNNTDIEMSRYGLYKELTQDKIDIINSNNCLYIALETLKMSTFKLQKFKSIVKTRHISICKLNEITELLNITIELYKFKNDEIGKHLKTTYGNNDLEIYKIGFYENHYFIYDNINYTAYSLINYFTLKDIKDFNKIYSTNSKGSYNKDEKRASINSLNALKIFQENKLMKPMDNNTINIFNTLFYDELKTTADDIEIIINDNEFKPADNLDNKGFINDDEIDEINLRKDNYNYCSFDFESFTKDGEIIPFLANLRSMDGKTLFTSYGENCVLDLLNSIKSDTCLIAHNCKFDYSFICNHLYKKQELFSGSRFICCKAIYNKHQLYIKDFYNLVAAPLKDMNKIFGLGTTIKEYIPYNLYNDESLNILKCKYAPYDLCMTYIKNKDDKATFLENCEKWRCFTTDKSKINIVKYAEEYCIIDNIVLCESYKTFQKWIMDAFNININDCLTTSSISRKLLQNKRVFKGCYKNCGAIQQYLKKFIVGGRVMCQDNKKHKVDDYIMPVDANSLYPSALVKTGFIKGKPKKLMPGSTYENIKDYTHYFIRIKIKKVGRSLLFGLQSVKDENGILNFTNDLCNNKIHYVDKNGLEDLIKYQKIEFDIIDGIYYDEGRNYDIKNLVDELYFIRQKRVKEENPIEMVYKLVLNSIYGIMIENEHTEQILNFDSESEFNIYLDLHHESISQYVNTGKNKYRVYVKSEISNHFNCSHLGIDILSYSKRIMNDLMSLCEINNINPYYQDTDSAAFLEKDIDAIEKLYFKEYGKNLVGAELGQFKTDLKIKGCENVRGLNAVFLGKKAYHILMTGTDKKTGATVICDKIRMAGVSDTTILYEIDNQMTEHGEKRFKDCKHLYDILFEGEEVPFDLCETDILTGKPGKFKVDYNKLNLNKTQKQHFIRKRQFK